MTIANDQVTLETNPSNEAKHENKIESKLLSKKVLFDGFIVAIFSFGFNFITTAEYAFFSPIMNDFGLNDDLKISIILSIALFSLCIGVMIGGVLSDSIRTNFGNRSPLIMIGGGITAIILLIIGLLSNILQRVSYSYIIIILLFMISHITLGVAYAPWLALIVDLFKKKERVIIGTLITIVNAIGAGVALLIFSKLIDNNRSNIVWIIAGIVFGSTAILTSILLPKKNPNFEPTIKIKEIIKIPKIIWKFGGKTWTILLIISTLWAFSTHLVETSIVNSLVDRFRVTQTIASTSSNLVMGIYIAVLLVPIILILNKMKKNHSAIIASILYGFFCLALALMKNPNAIYAIMVIGGAGNIMISILSIVLPADKVPIGKEACFLGMFFIFGTIIKPFATIIQGLILNNKIDNMTLNVFGGYPWVFLIAALVCFMSMILIGFMNEKAKVTKHKQLTENIYEKNKESRGINYL